MAALTSPRARCILLRMKKLAYVGMFLLAACSSAPSSSNAQAATPAGSCCSEKAEAKGGACCSETAPAAKSGESCCEAKKN